MTYLVSDTSAFTGGTAALVDELTSRGIRLRLVGDGLTLDAPKGALTPDLIRRVKADKPALLRLVVGHDYVAANPVRQRVIDLLLPIFRADSDRAITLRDAWMERIAIVAADPDCAEQAEAVAWVELAARAGDDNANTCISANYMVESQEPRYTIGHEKEKPGLGRPVASVHRIQRDDPLRHLQEHGDRPGHDEPVYDGEGGHEHRIP
jgi:hypothetical protein